MNSNLTMEFVVDKENHLLNVTREFAAPIARVWDAYTKSELLDQWWAPRPWKARTKTMNFEEGGHWLYAMVGPEGEEHWGRMDFISIQHHKKFVAQDVFCDADGNPNSELPSASFTTSFREAGDHTIVNIITKYPSDEQLEQVINMGMKEGLTMAMENLDELLSN